VGCGALRLQEVRDDNGDQLAEGGSDDLTYNPFKNILLVVHCRLSHHYDGSPEDVCEERRHLFDGYKKLFKGVYYMTPKECPPHVNDVHQCVSQLMKDYAMDRDGIFYMHFEAAFSASKLRLVFDKEMLASFGEDFRCRLNEKMRLKNCTSDRWAPGHAERYQQAIHAVQKEHHVELRRINMAVYLSDAGGDDMFYVPHKLFFLYSNLTHWFVKHGVHHEITGPTVRKLLEKITDVEDVNLHCGGGCCESFQPDGVVLSRHFKCGRVLAKNKSSEVDGYVQDERFNSGRPEVDRVEPDASQLSLVMRALTA